MKFRAYFKPDLYTKEGLIRFDPKEVDDELMWVANIDSDIRYPFFVPFMDSDWVIQRFVGINSNGVEFYEGDIISARLSKLFQIREDGKTDLFAGEILWSDSEKCFSIKGEVSRFWFSNIQIDTIEVVGHTIGQ